MSEVTEYDLHNGLNLAAVLQMSASIVNDLH